MTEPVSDPVSPESRSSVASRLLSLLGAFRPGDESVTLAELARRADLPQATALRLLRELTDWGALVRTPSGGYQIGLKLFHIGMLAPQQRGLREVALPFMQDLFDVTKENILLGVLSGTQVLYVEKIKGRNSAPAVTRSGGTLPAYVTAIGKVLLAYGPEDVRERVCSRELRQYTEHTIKDGAALRRELEQVRLRGYAVADQELRPSRVAVAAPVFNHLGEAVAGISVMGHAHKMDVSRVAPAVQTTALALSRQLGLESQPRRSRRPVN